MVYHGSLEKRLERGFGSECESAAEASTAIKKLIMNNLMSAYNHLVKCCLITAGSIVREHDWSQTIDLTAMVSC